MPWLFCFFALSASPALASGGRFGYDFTKKCPGSLREWLSAREALALVLSNVDDYGAQDAAARCLNEAKPLLTKAPSQACFAPLFDFLENKKNRFPSTEPLVSQEEYRKQAAPFVSVPEELNAKELLSEVSTGNMAEIEKYFSSVNGKRNAKGLSPFEFMEVAGMVRGLDDSGNRRLVVYDPGTKTVPTTKKWISFTLPVKGSKVSAVSVIATHEDKEGARSYFAEHTHDGGKITPHVSRDKAPKINCLECHFSGGPNAIHPPKGIDAKYKDALERVNESIEAQGITLNTKHFNPQLPRTGVPNVPVEVLPDEFFKHCAYKRASVPEPEDERARKVSLKKIRLAYAACITCHDGSNRPKLDPGRGRYSQGRYFENHVMSGAMPPGNNLTESERKGLVSCFWNQSSMNSDKYSGYDDDYHADRFVPGSHYYLLMAGKCPNTSVESREATPADGATRHRGN